eukprot:715290_1
MAALVNSIKFKLFASQLSATEFDEFLSQVTRSKGKEVILQLFCSPFLKPTGHYVDFDSLLTDMIAIIHHIIESREPENLDILQIKTGKLEQLPTTLIGAVASFLSVKAYSLFSRTNRAIFLGCNTPNTLTALRLCGINDYSSIHLQNYPQITQLSLRLYQLTSLPFQDSGETPMCTRLQKISLRGTGGIPAELDLMSIRTQNHFHLDQITEIRLCNVRLRASQVHYLLASFKFIQRLNLVSVRIDIYDRCHPITSACPRLRVLNITDVSGAIVNAILPVLSTQLDHLSICYANIRNVPVIALDDVNLSNLQTLCTSARTAQSSTFSKILDNAKQVRMLVFAGCDSATNHTPVKKAIIRQKHLECIAFSTTWTGFHPLINALGCALYTTRNCERKQLVIKFMFLEAFDVINIEKDFMLDIWRLVVRLRMYKTDDFMISWECHNKSFSLSTMDAMHGLIGKKIKSSTWMQLQLVKATQSVFVIGNQHCKIEIPILCDASRVILRSIR